MKLEIDKPNCPACGAISGQCCCPEEPLVKACPVCDGPLDACDCLPVRIADELTALRAFREATVGRKCPKCGDKKVEQGAATFRIPACLICHGTGKLPLTEAQRAALKPRPERAEDGKP